MIFAAIAEEWFARNDNKRAQGVIGDFLGSEDRRTGEFIAKLTLNEINDSIYQKLVLKRMSATSAERKLWPITNKLLDEAFNNIKVKVHSWVNEVEDVEARLLDLEDFIADDANVILIEVGDESDAFVIFETLNDRGLDLAVSDLVKNYLFSQAGSNIERFKKSWVEITLLVGSETLTPFLRHFWLSEHDVVRERELYRALRSSAKNTTAAREMIERLRKAADLYAALLNPEHAYWSDFPPEARTYLDALLLFKVTQFRPIALAAMEILNPEDITKVLHTLMVISFRYTVISASGTGNLEKIYTKSALAIRDQQAKTPAKVFSFLKPAYVPDDRFVEDFAGKSFGKAPIARYILAEINDHLENDPERMVSEKTGRISLEHILPKNPGAEWRNAIPPDNNLADYVDRIGNLTLLEKGKNRGVATLSFNDKKQKAFSQSGLAINIDISKYPSWKLAEIDERSHHLADIAKIVWQVNY